MDSGDANRIGLNIKNRREAVGLTQDDLFKITRISKKSLSQIETGKTNPRTANLSLIAKALKCSVGQLYTGEFEPKQLTPVGPLPATKEELMAILRESQEKLKNDLLASIPKRQPQAEYKEGSGVPNDILEALKTATEAQLDGVRATLRIKRIKPPKAHQKES